MSEQDQSLVDTVQDPSKVQVTIQVCTDDNGCRMSYNLGNGVKGPVLVFLAANLLGLTRKAIEFLREDIAGAGVSLEEFDAAVAAALRGEYEPDKPETPPEAEKREPL
jgi:hypothetical protein